MSNQMLQSKRVVPPFGLKQVGKYCMYVLAEFSNAIHGL